ncbi:MAG: hypothetical protein ABR548_14445 [Actinomycetota bacterium]|nr:hypothetical protein [Actinomycetota bacterium]
MGKKAREQRRREQQTADLITDLFIRCAQDPHTTPRDMAKAILAAFKCERVPPSLGGLLCTYASLEHARAVGAELIDLDPRGVSALTYNAAIAPNLEEAIELLTMAVARGGGSRVELDIENLMAEFGDPFRSRNTCSCATCTPATTN